MTIKVDTPKQPANSRHMSMHSSNKKGPEKPKELKGDQKIATQKGLFGLMGVKSLKDLSSKQKFMGAGLVLLAALTSIMGLDSSMKKDTAMGKFESFFVWGTNAQFSPAAIHNYDEDDSWLTKFKYFGLPRFVTSVATVGLLPWIINSSFKKSSKMPFLVKLIAPMIGFAVGDLALTEIWNRILWRSDGRINTNTSLTNTSISA